MTALHRYWKVLVLTPCLIAIGCRSYMSYTARPLDGTSDAKRIIYQTLDSQPGRLQSEVTDEKFSIALYHVD
jgi:hypothetical protein